MEPNEASSFNLLPPDFIADDNRMNTEVLWGGSGTASYIVHYTKFSTAQSIIKSGLLRMTDPRTGNDRHELNAAIKIATARVQAGISDAQLREWVTFSISYSNQPKFVTCFSGFDSVAQCDQLNMWQAYGDDGRGAALIYDGMQFFRELHARDAKCVARPVIYSQQRLIEMIDAYCANLNIHYNKFSKDLHRLISLFAGLQIQSACAFYKDYHYEYEKEYRILKVSPGREDIKFHQTPDFFSPFLDLSFKTRLDSRVVQIAADRDGAHRLCLIGPSTDQDRLAALLSSCYYAIGHSSPEDCIARSRIPYRSVHKS